MKKKVARVGYIHNPEGGGGRYSVFYDRKHSFSRSPYLRSRGSRRARTRARRACACPAGTSR